MTSSCANSPTPQSQANQSNKVMPSSSMGSEKPEKEQPMSICMSLTSASHLGLPLIQAFANQLVLTGFPADALYLLRRADGLRIGRA